MNKLNFFTLSTIILGLLTFSNASQAFPLMVKHGYTTCITCHFSPSGGGLLTSYGKFIAGELFGRYNTSENALNWLTLPEEEKIFHAGVFFRAVQSYLDTPTLRRAKTERMQGDIELVATKGPFFGEVNLGFRGSSIQNDQTESDLMLRAFYFGARDYWYAIRAGRFFPEFGIRHPNHNVPTRKGLFWNHNEEPYLLQGSYLTETFDFTLGLLKGAEGTQLKDKEGYTYTLAYKTGRSRTGISVLDASYNQDHSKAMSLFTLMGFEDQIYLLAEFSKKNEIKSNDRQSWLTFFELGYEFSKGVIPYLGFESTSISTSSNGTSGPEILTRNFPVGIKFYPYTHFEIIGQISKGEQISSSGSDSIISAFLMGNAYF